MFRLAYPFSMPDELAARLDQRITATITSFKRFNVIGMQYRLRAADRLAFIQKIQEAKSDMSNLPETVLSGEEAFTRADWEQLTSAFLVFVPYISSYEERILYEEVKTQEGARRIQPYWKINIEGSLSIIDASGAMSQRTLPFSASSMLPHRSDAIDSAIDSITASIYRTIKFESSFALTTGVIDVDHRANTIMIELGQNMGISVGDEYRIQKNVFIGGRPTPVTTGFCIISEVHDTFSVAKIIYANQPIVAGDSVKESPSSHVTVQGYGGITVPLTGVQSSKAQDYLQIQPTFGIKMTYLSSFHTGVSLGYEYAIQQPLKSYSSTYTQSPLRFFPFGTIYFGLGFYNLYTARFKITPELQFCYAGINVYGESLDKNQYRYKSSFSTIASQIEGRALLTAHYFISQDWTFDASAGLGYRYALTNAAKVAQRLHEVGAFSTYDVQHIDDYTFNILHSHLQFYCFLGITGRL